LDLAIDYVDVGDAALVADFAAELGDGGAQVLDDFGEAVGADVGFVDVEDFGGGSGLDEFGEDFAALAIAVFDATVEFAVGEGACSAFAILGVGFGVEFGFAPEAEGVAGAIDDGFAAFEEDGAEAHLGEDEGGEGAAGAVADD
jgi:hypothetical protein